MERGRRIGRGAVSQTWEASTTRPVICSSSFFCISGHAVSCTLGLGASILPRSTDRRPVRLISAAALGRWWVGLFTPIDSGAMTVSSFGSVSVGSLALAAATSSRCSASLILASSASSSTSASAREENGMSRLRQAEILLQMAGKAAHALGRVGIAGEFDQRVLLPVGQRNGGDGGRRQGFPAAGLPLLDLGRLVGLLGRVAAGVPDLLDG